MSDKKDKIISIGDIALMIGVIAFCVAGIILLVSNSKPGGNVTVTVDGEAVESFPLNKDTEYVVNTDNGMNIIVIKDGVVSVSNADCPDKICVQHPPIDSTGETIICLPHKLVIEIVE